MRLALAILIFVSIPSIARAQAPAPAADLETFVRRLDDLSAKLDAAAAADIPALTADLPAAWRVRAGDQEILVPFEAIVRRMSDARSSPDTWPSTRADIVNRLAAMQREARAFGTEEGAPAGAALRDTLTGVLARPEFARAARRSWTTELRERLAEWLRELWSRLGGDRLNSRSVAQGLAWLAVIVALAAIGWVMKSRAGGERAALHIGVGEIPPLPSRDWALRAVAAAAAGDSREAVRCAYRAAVRRIEEQGGWRTDEARTPREYGALFRPDDGRATVFRTIALQFERAWYGRRQLSQDDLHIVTHSLERLGCLRVHERTI